MIIRIIKDYSLCFPLHLYLPLTIDPHKNVMIFIKWYRGSSIVVDIKSSLLLFANDDHHDHDDNDDEDNNDGSSSA